MSEPHHHLHLATDEVNSFWLGEVEGKVFHQAFLRALSRPGEDPQGAAWQGEVGRGRTDVGRVGGLEGLQIHSLRAGCTKKVSLRAMVSWSLGSFEATGTNSAPWAPRCYPASWVRERRSEKMTTEFSKDGTDQLARRWASIHRGLMYKLEDGVVSIDRLIKQVLTKGFLRAGDNSVLGVQQGTNRLKSSGGLDSSWEKQILVGRNY